MSENILCLFVTAGLIGLTAAWVPFLASCHRGLRRVWAEPAAGDRNQDHGMQQATEC